MFVKYLDLSRLRGGTSGFYPATAQRVLPKENHGSLPSKAVGRYGFTLRCADGGAAMTATIAAWASASGSNASIFAALS